jgi:pimeloyl-ACP methyl ester carboxylesterase
MTATPIASLVLAGLLVGFTSTSLTSETPAPAPAAADVAQSDLAHGGFAQDAPTPPDQPPSGPGGKDYAHAGLTTTRLGSGAQGAILFEPADPRPEAAPVVVFCHGWSVLDPVHYGAWITHIVRRGYTVIYPLYQDDIRTPPREFTRHALVGTRRGYEMLRTPGHVAADSRGLAFVGHSIGGLVASNLAAAAAKGQLPRALALMSVEPGKTWPEMSRIAFPLADLSILPPELLLVAVAGEDDDFVGDIDARKVYTTATNVLPANKNYVRMFSDDHGTPVLTADHRMASAPGGMVESTGESPWVEGDAPAQDADDNGRGEVVTNTLDFYGTWKLFDGLADAVFRGVNREYALGDTPPQRYMGAWSDRVPVRELMIGLP